jgi:hypothetical protein
MIWSLALSLIACIPATPVDSDIVGVWVEDQPRSMSEGTVICGSFEFFPDGHFEAWSIPLEYFSDSSPMRINASGSWELDTSADDPFAVHRVELLFEPVPTLPLGFGSEFGISTDGHVLFQGQEGNRILFVKKEVAGCG